jgi:hypothetical protein
MMPSLFAARLRAIAAPIAALATALSILAAAPSAHAAKSVTHKPVYGAIALDRASGDAGYAALRRNTNEAKLDALQACGSNGCEVVLQFRGECGALAWSPTAGGLGGKAAAKDRAPAPKYSTSRGVTRAEAETKARRACGAKDCDIKLWACSR